MTSFMSELEKGKKDRHKERRVIHVIRRVF